MMEEYQGLTARQAEKRLLEHGENKIRSGKKASALKLFAGQFRDAMIMILLAATVVSALMGEYTEAMTIIAIVFVNALLGFFQEYRTERTLEERARRGSCIAEMRSLLSFNTTGVQKRTIKTPYIKSFY